MDYQELVTQHTAEDGTVDHEAIASALNDQFVSKDEIESSFVTKEDHEAELQKARSGSFKAGKQQVGSTEIPSEVNEQLKKQQETIDKLMANQSEITKQSELKEWTREAKAKGLTEDQIELLITTSGGIVENLKKVSLEGIALPKATDFGNNAGMNDPEEVKKATARQNALEIFKKL